MIDIIEMALTTLRNNVGAIQDDEEMTDAIDAVESETGTMRRQLAAAQREIERLRDALKEIADRADGVQGDGTYPKRLNEIHKIAKKAISAAPAAEGEKL